MPPAKKSTANHRNEDNVEKYIQWVTTSLPTTWVYLHSFSSCYLPNLWNSTKIIRKFELTAVQGHPRWSILMLIEST